MECHLPQCYLPPDTSEHTPPESQPSATEQKYTDSHSVALGGSEVQERSRSSVHKLKEHSQQGLVKDGNHLGWEEVEVAAQNRSEWCRSECGPMHPLGCRLNQGQGQGQVTVTKSWLMLRIQVTTSQHNPNISTSTITSYNTFLDRIDRLIQLKPK